MEATRKTKVVVIAAVSLILFIGISLTVLFATRPTTQTQPPPPDTPPDNAPPAAPTKNCDFCYKWAKKVLANVRVNSSSSYLGKVLDKVCQSYEGLENELCREYNNRINGVSRVPGEKPGENFKQTAYTKQQLKFGITAELLCADLRQCGCCLKPSKPEQVHLAIFNETTYSVMWTTSDDVEGYVRWAIKGEQHFHREKSTVSTFTSGDWEGYLHLAYMTNLTTNQYTYFVGNEEAWSDKYDFKFKSPSNSSNVRFAYVADMGTDLCSDSTVNSLIREATANNPVEFIYHGGDIAYTVEDSYIYDVFNRKIEPFASVVPYMVTVGNHEVAFEYENYLKRYHMPHKSSGSPNNFWYSWNWGPIHFISYSTEHDLSIGSIQYDWLLADLQRNEKERNQRPWLIAIGHQMTYCSTESSDCKSKTIEIKDSLEPLFYQYKVDLVLNGHAHSYERSYPVHMGKQEGTYDAPGAPVYIYNGCGGAHATSEGDCDLDYDWSPNQPKWSANRFTLPGYSMINVVENELTFEMIGSNDGKVHDSVTIRRPMK